MSKQFLGNQYKKIIKLKVSPSQKLKRPKEQLKIIEQEIKNRGLR